MKKVELCPVDSLEWTEDMEFKIYRNMKKVITASGKCYGYNVQDKCAIYFE